MGIEALSEELQQSYWNYCMKVDNNIDINSVILSEENKDKLKTFIWESKNKAEFMEYGLEPLNRIIMYGASGTGKTYLTKALSNELGYTMLYIDIAKALASETVASNLEEIFSIANAIGKAIIFLDECDSICKDRSKYKNKSEATNMANNALFQLLDQMNPECIFISATNLYDELDAAFVRRFEIRMRFDRPKLVDLDATINKFLLPKFTLKYDMDGKIKRVILEHAKNYTTLSYDEIQTWVERAEKVAIVNGSTEVSEAEVYRQFMIAMRLVGFEDFTGNTRLYQM